MSQPSEIADRAAADALFEALPDLGSSIGRVPGLAA